MFGFCRQAFTIRQFPLFQFPAYFIFRPPLPAVSAGHRPAAFPVVCNGNAASAPPALAVCIGAVVAGVAVAAARLAPAFGIPCRSGIRLTASAVLPRPPVPLIICHAAFRIHRRWPPVGRPECFSFGARHAGSARCSSSPSIACLASHRLVRLRPPLPPPCAFVRLASAALIRLPASLAPLRLFRLRLRPLLLSFHFHFRGPGAGWAWAPGRGPGVPGIPFGHHSGSPPGLGPPAGTGLGTWAWGRGLGPGPGPGAWAGWAGTPGSPARARLMAVRAWPAVTGPGPGTALAHHYSDCRLFGSAFIRLSGSLSADPAFHRPTAASGALAGAASAWAGPGRARRRRCQHWGISQFGFRPLHQASIRPFPGQQQPLRHRATTACIGLGRAGFFNFDASQPGDRLGHHRANGPGLTHWQAAQRSRSWASHTGITTG